MTLELNNQQGQNGHPEDRDLDIGSDLDEYGSTQHQKMLAGQDIPPIDRVKGPQTGPKGVIADHKYTKDKQYKQYQENIREQKAFMKSKYGNKPLEPVQTLWQKEGVSQESYLTSLQPGQLSASGSRLNSKSDSEVESDFSDIDEIGSDEERILEQYKKEKLYQLEKAMNLHSHGKLMQMSAVEYVSFVDAHESDNTFIIVLLHFENYPISERFKAQLEKLVSKYPCHKFLVVDATECGFKDPEVMPIMLVYQRGELVANHVKATSMLDSPTKFDDGMIDTTFISVLHE